MTQFTLQNATSTFHSKITVSQTVLYIQDVEDFLNESNIINNEFESQKCISTITVPQIQAIVKF